MEITVYTAKFHGGEIIYRGKSEKQAIRIARRECGSRWNSDCKCGGAVIQAVDEDGTFRIHGWEATPPFQRANEIRWEFICPENEI